MPAIDTTRASVQNIGRVTRSILSWEIPAEKYERYGLYSQVLLVLVFWTLMEEYPVITGRSIPTGFAIAGLAFAAVCMAARTDKLTLTEKIVWIFISATLFIWELRVIDQEHVQQDHQHLSDVQEEHKAFEKIEERFEATLKRTDDIFKASTKTSEIATRAVGELTGGDSYMYFTVPHFAGLRGANESTEFPIDFVVEGSYPMRNVSAIYQKQQAQPTGLVPLEAALHSNTRIPLEETQLPGPHLLPDTRIGMGTYSFAIWSTNGVISENLQLRWENGDIVESFAVTRGKIVLEKQVNNELTIHDGKPYTDPRKKKAIKLRK